MPIDFIVDRSVISNDIVDPNAHHIKNTLKKINFNVLLNLGGSRDSIQEKSMTRKTLSLCLKAERRFSFSSIFAAIGGGYDRLHIKPLGQIGCSLNPKLTSSLSGIVLVCVYMYNFNDFGVDFCCGLDLANFVQVYGGLRSSLFKSKTFKTVINPIAQTSKINTTSQYDKEKLKEALSDSEKNEKELLEEIDNYENLVVSVQNFLNQGTLTKKARADFSNAYYRLKRAEDVVWSCNNKIAAIEESITRCTNNSEKIQKEKELEDKKAILDTKIKEMEELKKSCEEKEEMNKSINRNNGNLDIYKSKIKSLNGKLKNVQRNITKYQADLDECNKEEVARKASNNTITYVDKESGLVKSWTITIHLSLYKFMNLFLHT